MSGSSSSMQGASEGDWICPSTKCANLNFARRMSCNRCGSSKPKDTASKKKFGIEIGKAAAEKSKGLFSADDWQCSKCGNVNWARRSTCNVCNAPRVGDVEERTGFGGGYNERDGVEYKERANESDDEYDNWGRKKKGPRKEAVPVPARGSIVDAPPAPKESEHEEDDGDDDDDEDDDDDDDLSKYDLSGWGDADESKDLPEPAAVQRDKTSNRPAPAQHSSSSGSSSTSSSSRSRSMSRSRSRSDSRSRSRNGRWSGRRHSSSSRSRDALPSGAARRRSRSRSRSDSKSQGRRHRSRSRSRSPVRR